MKAKFKCQNCEHEFSQEMEHWRVFEDGRQAPVGTMVGFCPNCKHDYMDCLNLEECIEHANKLDKERGWVN
jgi:hypothetical protein